MKKLLIMLAMACLPVIAQTVGNGTDGFASKLYDVVKYSIVSLKKVDTKSMAETGISDETIAFHNKYKHKFIEELESIMKPKKGKKTLTLQVVDDLVSYSGGGPYSVSMGTLPFPYAPIVLNKSMCIKLKQSELIKDMLIQVASHYLGVLAPQKEGFLDQWAESIRYSIIEVRKAH